MIRLVLLALLLPACNPPIDSGDTATTDTGDTGMPSGETHAVVTTTDFSVGALATVDLGTFAVDDDLVPTSSDPYVAVQQDEVFQFNGLGIDNVAIYTPGAWSAPQEQFSVGDGTNPHGVALIDGALFVSLYEENALGVFDPTDGSSLGSVDLSAYAGSDGIPEASTMVVVGGKLYVALERLDRNNGWTDDGGTVVQVDPTTKTVTKAWAVGPSPIVYPHPTDPNKLMVRTGLYAQAVGGLRVLDPSKDAPDPLLLDASALGYGISGYAGSRIGVGLIVGEHTDATYTLSCVAPDGTLTHAYGPTSDWLVNPVVDDRGRAWVAVRSSSGTSGLLVVDLFTCQVLTDTPIQTDLPPYGIAFYR